MGKRSLISGANGSLGCEIRFEIRTENLVNAVPASEEGGVLRNTFRKILWVDENFPRHQNTAISMGRPHNKAAPRLLADAEFPNDSFVALGIVSLEVVEQATPLADQHEQAAARAVVLLVRFEVIRQLANAFTDDGDLNLRTPGVSRVRLILVNDRFLLLSG